MSTLLPPASSSRIGKKDETVYLRTIPLSGVMSSDAADNTSAAESKAAAEMAAKDAPQPAYNEWAAAMSAYYKQAPPPTAYYGPAPSHPHPYMWGAHQPMMPYGTPPPNPYYGSYHPGMTAPPPGGYGYVQPTTGAMGAKTPGSENGDMGGDWSKTAMTGSTPLSLPPPSSTGRTGETGSEGSSGSDSADMLRRNKRSFDTITSDGMPRGVQMGANTGAAGNGGAAAFNQAAARNNGEQMWSGLTANARRSSGGNLAAEMVPFQDEREVKRQRRKQSNRESARRSRLRKQAECEDLGSRVNTLTVENMGLRTELTRLQERCGQLAMENAALLEKCKGAGLQVDSLGPTAGRGGGQGDIEGGAYHQSSGADGRSSEQQQDASTGVLTEGATQLSGIAELSGGSL
eukprot:TRINITY_DN1740_c0_g1_i4.p1 TRINITY_DN1740_c0_g1~~TRINITY_DN1740_c0_g1_i4.p1  ORF type:complete len:403 (-),score=90.83 TRINITY_DN1740_c0_g1_i4:696-1904(-)